MFLPILFDVHGTYGRLGPGSSFDVETLLGRRALNSALRASTHKNKMTTCLLYLTVPCMVLFHLGVGCLLFMFFWIVFWGKDLLFLKDFFLCSAWAAFLAICCILGLKSVFCMHFGARIPCLRAYLAFGFWLLAFGFGFTWLHLALVLAVHFTWFLAFVELCIVVCI